MSTKVDPSLLSVLQRPPAKESQSQALKTVISGASKARSLKTRLLGMAGGVSLVGCIGYFAVISGWSGSSRSDRPLVAPVKRANLLVTVTERGSLESCNTVYGICEVGGQNKVVFLVPEGARVKKGDVVCKLDDVDIKKNLAQQEIQVKQALTLIETTRQDTEIQRNTRENEIIAAKVDLSLAELDLKKYEEGDYPADIAKSQGDVQIKKTDMEAESTKLEQYKALMKKGFKTHEDVRLQISTVAAKQLDYSSAEKYLQVKQKYEYRRKTTEFKTKVDQARKRVELAQASARADLLKGTSANESAKQTADIQKRQLSEYQRQLDKTVITAGQDGIVAYANDAYYDASRQIREGATVYYQQKIFSLPDMSRMQVKVNTHESVIKKLKAGQPAEIRIDAFPNAMFTGQVKSVSSLADSSRSWVNAGVKEYPTIVALDDLKGLALKPGMTAEAKIFVGERDNVLVVPLQAVAQHKGEFSTFVDDDDGIERRPVKIGESNEQFVEIVEGLSEGESVALDARSRSAAEFKTEESKEPGEKTSKNPAIASRNP
ncbi:MAG: efflux RND transporter periplasmic adaptor subunit [Isosphaeraceae bacterium]